MDPEYGRRNIIPGITIVVDMITGRSARAEKILNNSVQVSVKQRGYELENWPWSWLTIRTPRRIKRYPRPFRFPRREKTNQCHCRIGKMVIEDAKENTVRCQRCKKLVGSESFHRRIHRAADMLRKADAPIKTRSKIRKGVSASKRKAARSSNISRKVGKKSFSRVGVRSTGRSRNEKAARGIKVRKRSKPVSKGKGRARSVSKGKSNPKISKIRKKRTTSKNVRRRNSSKKASTIDKVDIMASVPESNTSDDVRGPGSGGATDTSEMLPGVPGGADTIH